MKKTFFRSIILFSIFFFGFTSKSNAQGPACYHVTIVNNQSACQWDATGIKGASSTLWTVHVPPGTSTVACRDYFSDTITSIKLTLDNRCAPIIFTIAGGWAETITQSCSPSCSTPGATVVCTETLSSSCPSPCLTTAEILITIN